jgi:hypothetical protein
MWSSVVSVVRPRYPNRTLRSFLTGNITRRYTPTCAPGCCSRRLRTSPEWSHPVSELPATGKRPRTCARCPFPAALRHSSQGGSSVRPIRAFPLAPTPGPRSPGFRFAPSWGFSCLEDWQVTGRREGARKRAQRSEQKEKGVRFFKKAAIQRRPLLGPRGQTRSRQ